MTYEHHTKLRKLRALGFSLIINSNSRNSASSLSTQGQKLATGLERKTGKNGRQLK